MATRRWEDVRPGIIAGLAEQTGRTIEQVEADIAEQSRYLIGLTDAPDLNMNDAAHWES